jgi:hypothetical protein
MTRGFSIIESVLYLSLFVVLSTGVVLFSFSGLEAFRRTRATSLLASAAHGSVERLVREIRSAESVNISESVFNVSPGKLVLVRPGGGTVVFLVINDRLFIDTDSALPVSLVPEGVAVESLIFRHITVTNSQAVRIELALSSRQESFSITAPFYTTAVLRAGY